MALAHLRGFAQLGEQRGEPSVPKGIIPRMHGPWSVPKGIVPSLRPWQVSNLAAIERFAAKPFELLARLGVV